MTLGIFIIIALIVFFAFRSMQRKANAATTTATIMIGPDGASVVTFVPETRDPDILVGLLVCYGVKLRWLLNREPEAARQLLESITASAIDSWDEPGTASVAHDTVMAKVVRAGMIGAQMTVPGGERFVVRYVPGVSSAITNDIPRPGMSMNLAWHYIELMDAVRRRLEPEDRAWAKRVLQEWQIRSCSPAADDASLGALRPLMDAARRDMLRARAAHALETEIVRDQASLDTDVAALAGRRFATEAEARTVMDAINARHHDIEARKARLQSLA